MKFRTIQITPVNTVFLQEGGPFVRIRTSTWVGQPYIDLTQSVQHHIVAWMDGSDTVENLVERLQVHKLNPEII